MFLASKLFQFKCASNLSIKMYAWYLIININNMKGAILELVVKVAKI